MKVVEPRSGARHRTLVFAEVVALDRVVAVAPALIPITITITDYPS